MKMITTAIMARKKCHTCSHGHIPGAHKQTAQSRQPPQAGLDEAAAEQDEDAATEQALMEQALAAVKSWAVRVGPSPLGGDSTLPNPELHH